MPGGFCRISDRPDARAVAMGEGVESADVGVLADNPVEVSSLLPSRKARESRVCWATFPAAPRITFSGSADTLNGLRQRCGLYAA